MTLSRPSVPVSYSILYLWLASSNGRSVSMSKTKQFRRNVSSTYYNYKP